MGGGGAGFGDITEIAQNKTIEIKSEMVFGQSSNIHRHTYKCTCTKLKRLDTGGKRDRLMAGETTSSIV